MAVDKVGEDQLRLVDSIHALLTVGRCRLTLSKPELKAHLVSAFETEII